MAESGDTSETPGKFPPEIVSSDDDPSRGFFSLTLTIPGMKTKKGMFDKVAKVTNGECTVTITDSEVTVSAKIDDGGKSTSYKYFKKLPEKVSDLRSKFKLKNEQVILILAKVEKVSWGQHSTYFMRRT